MGHGIQETGTSRSALFVDFDNTYLGLKRLDEAAAEAFATDPAKWLGWLEQGRDPEGLGGRRFLVRNVYLNPAAFSTFRAIYTRAGFRTVDCPPLTRQGKNSADIYMVLDIVDALGGPTRYDEYVIASADADFTPVLHRLRANDRRITLLTAGVSASAYRAVCDSFISPELLADACLGETDLAGAPVVAERPAGVVAPPPSARESAQLRNAASTKERIEAIADAIRAAVRDADRPIVSAAAAQAALVVEPRLKELDWLGAGAFRAFLALYVDDMVYASQPSPGYVFDPSRHTVDDIPQVDNKSELDPFQQLVCASTGAPSLDSIHYAALFTALADELQEAPFNRTETSKRVRDRTDLQGTSVSRNAVNFVINGLLFNGTRLIAGITASDLASAWAANLENLCANATLILTPDQRDALIRWVVSVE
jgi:hypothetical protein